MARTPAGARDGVSNRQGGIPSALLSRVPLPTDLVDAIALVLECEALEPDLVARAELLSRTHEILREWLAGTVSTDEAVGRLTADVDPKSRVVRRPEFPR